MVTNQGARVYFFLIFLKVTRTNKLYYDTTYKSSLIKKESLNCSYSTNNAVSKLRCAPQINSYGTCCCLQCGTSSMQPMQQRTATLPEPRFVAWCQQQQLRCRAALGARSGKGGGQAIEHCCGTCKACMIRRRTNISGRYGAPLSACTV